MSTNRIRAFTGARADEKAARVGMWFKAVAGDDAAKAWCIENRVGLTKATGESVNSIGGFLAPTDFDDAIIRVRETFGAYRQGAEIGRRDRMDRFARAGSVASLQISSRKVRQFRS